MQAGPPSEQIVFAGDSLIFSGPWKSFFKNGHIHNSGVVGDTTQDLLNRVDEILAVKPGKIFLMIGINDHPQENNIDTILNTYRKILQKIQQNLPESHIYIHSILPVNNERLKTYYHQQISNENIMKLNKAILSLTQNGPVTYIDLYPHFLKDGELNPDMTKDGVHLNREGYLLWKNLIAGYIQ